MLIGAHESIAGGIAGAVDRGEEDLCEVIQIFTGAPSRWSVPPITGAAAERFRERMAASTLRGFMVHGAYLINPATPDPKLWRRSLEALSAEYGRCAAIGAPFLIIHPGSTRGGPAKIGISRAAEMVRTVLDRFPEGPMILLENTAGSGHTLGAGFGDLARIMDQADNDRRVGCCFDTAHAFAAGYDLRDADGLARSLKRIDREVGLERIKAVHLNDSARELGSRVDRHARIGEGHLGERAFAALFARPEFSGLPASLETVPDKDHRVRYRPQVQLLKKLRKAAL